MLLVGWLAIFACLAEAQRTLVVAVLGSNSGPFAPFGHTNRAIGTLWQNGVHGSIGGLRIQPQVLYYDVQTNATLTAMYTEQAIAAGAQVILAPESFLASITIAIACPLGIPVVVGLGGTSDIFLNRQGQRNCPHVYGTMTPASLYFREMLDLAKMIGQRSPGLTTVGAIAYGFSANVETCAGAVQLARAYGMPVVVDELVPAVDFGPMDQKVFVDTLLGPIAAARPDLLIVCHFQECAMWIQALSTTTDWTPTIGAFECASYINSLTALGTPVQFIITPLQWDPTVRGADYADVLGRPYANQFANSTAFYQTLMDELVREGDALPPSSLVASQYAAFQMVEAAVFHGNCTNAACLRDHLGGVTFQAVLGLVATDDTGRNSFKSMILDQVDVNYHLQVISPVGSADYPAVMPVPSWDERIYHAGFRVYAPESDTIVMVVAIMCFLLGVASIVLLVVFRDTQDVKATSLPFSIVSMVGYMLLCLAPLTWRSDNDQTSCWVRTPLWIGGFLLMILPHFVKTARVAFIFHRSQLTVVKIMDWQLGLTILVLSLPLLLTTVIWMASEPPVLQLNIVDVDRPAYNYSDCAGYSGSFLVAVVVLMLLILGVGCIVAFYTYRINDVRFNNAKPTALAIGVFFWLFATDVTITAVFSSNRAGIYLWRSLALQVGATCSQAAIFVGRFYEAWASHYSGTIGTKFTQSSHEHPHGPVARNAVARASAVPGPASDAPQGLPAQAAEGPTRQAWKKNDV